MPVINVYDTVATAEIRHGDNDVLAARVAQMASADCLLLLLDVDGLYTADPNKDPNAQFIERVRRVTPEIESMAGGSMSDVGSGGMATKIGRSEDRCVCRPSYVHLGRPPRTPQSAASRRARAATWFAADRKPERPPASSGSPLRRAPAGALTIDERRAGRPCAQARACCRPASKRPRPVRPRDTISVLAPDGTEVARGIVAYPDADAKRIMGRKSSEIETLLGFSGRAEMIHRDDLVILNGPDPEATDNTGGRAMSPYQLRPVSNAPQHTAAADDVGPLMEQMGRAALAASDVLAQASTQQKNDALTAAAKAVRSSREGHPRGQR